MEEISVLFLLGVLCVIAYMDWKQLRIPNRLLVLLLAWYPVQLSLMSWKDSLSGGLLGGGIFLAACLCSRGKVGMGDVKLMAVLGLYLGWQSIGECMFFSLLLAAVFGLSMMAAGKMNRKSCIPYAPFVLGAVCIHYLLLFRQGG